MKKIIKQPASWAIAIILPDGRKKIKKRCSLDELFEIYFTGIDKHLDKEAEDILKCYKDNYSKKNIKVLINYYDSWGHIWNGKVAWPKEDKFIEYLNKIK